MNTGQVYDFFKDKCVVPCPNTDRLVQAGYQQESGGYINCAKEQGMVVDYRECKPSQWWHLIECYCRKTNEDVTFDKKIVCGELILWMAEVSQAVDSDTLNDLVCRIIKSGKPCRRRKGSTSPVICFDRRKWGKEIQDLCFDKIVQKVEAASEH